MSAIRRVLAAPGEGSGALLVGISGIDASGKSTLARAVFARLVEAGITSAPLTVDWFHTRAHQRFLTGARAAEPPEAHGQHFFQHAFRWTDLFDRLIDPLRARGACDAVVDVHDIKSDAMTPAHIRHAGVKVILLEGIFIFRREFASRFDLRIWVECPFEVAMGRALARNQEGLSPEAVRADYERVYFPAQRHHMSRDQPGAGAHLVLASR